MLQHRVISSTRPWRSIRFASQSTQSLSDGGRSPVKTTATTSGNARKPSSILSRLSDRTESGVRRDSDTKQKRPSARFGVAPEAHSTPRRRVTSFITARSAQKRDHATEKWFTDVRELDIINVDQPDDLKSSPRKKRMGSESLKQHEMRPRTDLNALFTPSATPSAASLRLQTKRELGGDYTSYLPAEFADPNRLPVAYARLILGRNKHIPLNAQAGALNIIEEAIRGKATRQVV